MFNITNYYRGNDLLNDNDRERRKNLLNPFEYNFESNVRNMVDKNKNFEKTNCNINKKINSKKNL